MKKRGHVISEVEEGSIAQELLLSEGDILTRINGKSVADIFDYHYLTNEEQLVLLVEKADGEEWELEIEKSAEEDLGIIFESEFMDEYRSCSNKCIFCFIDQMPKGMRETLYFKDDDSRLSFLQGNYVTLTNMKEEDIRRIIDYRMSPINISFHTTNPELRCKMLNNRFAGESLKKAEQLYEAGIVMNGQIVLCRGINDGAELEQSIRDLSRFIPLLQSVSVVPVGLSRHRENLYPLAPFHAEDAKKVLRTIHEWQERLFKQYGTHFIHGGDEWYLLAGAEIPAADTYDGYLQLENGVGMLRLLLDETEEAVSDLRESDRDLTISLATGVLAFDTVQAVVNEVCKKYRKLRVNLYKIENRFFGTQITVSGLITGGDLIDQLEGQPLGDRLLLPSNMLRSGEDVFLDDITVGELEKTLQVKVDIVKSSGQDLIHALTR